MVDKQSDRTGRESGIPERAKDPGFWKEIWHQIRLVFLLMRDPEVPAYLKLLPAAAVLYVLFPLDFAPDIYPILGQLDDLTALLVGAKVFIEMAPPHVVSRHMNRMQEGVENIHDEEDDVLDDAIIVDAEHEMINGSGEKQD